MADAPHSSDSSTHHAPPPSANAAKASLPSDRVSSDDPAAERRLAQTLTLLNAGVFDVDLRSGKTFWSDENFRLLGLEPGSVEPSVQAFLAAIHPDDRARNAESMTRALAGERPLDDTHRVIHPDGSIRWMRGTGVVIRDDQGHAVGISGLSLDVTEPMLAGIARRESAERHSRTLAALNAGVWELDFVRGTLLWNEQGDRILGLEPGTVEPSVDVFLGQVHPEDRAQVQDVLQRGAAGEVPLEAEHRVIDADGTVRWVSHVGVLIRNEQGTPLQGWGISLDVTARRAAEEAARTSRARAERRSEAQVSVSKALAGALTIDEAMPAVLEAFGNLLDWDLGEVWLEDRESGGLRAAAVWARDGFDAHAFEADSLARVFSPGEGIPGRVWNEAEPLWVADVQDQAWFPRRFVARAVGIHTAFAVPIVRRTGTVGVIEFFSRARQEPDPVILNMFGALGSQLGEFMERVDTARALRDSERQMRDVIDTALDAVIAIDEQGVIVNWNPQAERLFGWTFEQVNGKALDEVIVPEGYREAHRRGMARYLSSGVATVLNQRLELEALHRDGHAFPIELSIALLRPWQPPPGSGRRAGPAFSAFIRDISERRRAELALLQAKEQAEATARARSEFLAVMSHEIRTPLNGVIGMLGLLLKTELTAAQRQQLLTARRSADILLAVTNDALDFSKIEAGRLVIEQTPFDLDQLLDDVVGTVRPQVPAGVELMVVSHGYRPGVVLGDPMRLRQILVNLVGNAAKFTKAGQIYLRVESTDAADDGTIPFSFTVEDSGIGIPADKHHSIFEAFSQAEASTTRRFGGTGLGLPIARQLAQLMDGTLRLVSSSPTGSIFELTLGLTPATLPRVKAPGQASVTVSGHVLVVDDNQVNRDIASAMLRHAGCTVDVEDGGVAALERIGHTHYDLVFMDCQMPGMDGYDATRAVRGLGFTPERLPVVAMTAGALAEDRERSFGAGMNDHLTKPVLEDALLEVLARWLPHVTQPASLPLPSDEEPVAEASPAPHFNMRTILRTRELMDEVPGSWDAMVASFVSHGQGMLEKLAASVADTRFDDVRRGAHNLKGSASMIGALRLSAWSADLEQAALDSRTMLCGRLVAKVREEFDAVARALTLDDFSS